MEWKTACPNCGKKHVIEDEDFYIDEDEERYRSDPHLCWDCYRSLEDLRVINRIAIILDSLNEEQRDQIADLLEILASFPSHESSLYSRIIREHFRGAEGIKSWGLW